MQGSLIEKIRRCFICEINLANNHFRIYRNLKIECKSLCPSRNERKRDGGRAERRKTRKKRLIHVILSIPKIEIVPLRHDVFSSGIAQTRESAREADSTRKKGLLRAYGGCLG